MSTKSDILKKHSSQLLENSSKGIEHAAGLIQNGKLVAFPTETVYGLGANALNEDAVKSIFLAKGRPLTDPLIVHVATIEDAHKLLDLSKMENMVFNCLSHAFWPGPLTIIAKASKVIPLLVTAQTGFVGVRIPSHPIALKLLLASKLPIAAPSANRFAHVSPTRAHHVLDDLGDKGVYVLNGESGDVSDDSSESLDSPSTISCQFGIESTVLRINSQSKSLTIFRQGAVTRTDIEKCLSAYGEGLELWTIEISSRQVSLTHTSKEQTNASLVSGESPAVGEVAPGQAITHYSPDVPCYIVNSIIAATTDTAAISNDNTNIERITRDDLKSTVVIDFHGRLKALCPYTHHYKDLSSSGDVSEAARNLFDYLRWSESIENATRVYLPSFLNQEQQEDDKEGTQVVNELIFGVADRATRAASGKTIVLALSL